MLQYNSVMAWLGNKIPAYFTNNTQSDLKVGNGWVFRGVYMGSQQCSIQFIISSLLYTVIMPQMQLPFLLGSPFT